MSRVILSRHWSRKGPRLPKSVKAAIARRKAAQVNGGRAKRAVREGIR
jgi:hypothetical protein